MSIRFNCAACGQPIEIDDQWASRPVACPYCRKTVTAPEESTLDEQSICPDARPFDGGFSQPESSSGAPPYPPYVPPYGEVQGGSVKDGQSGTILGVVALILALLCVGLFMTAAVLLAPPLNAFMEKVGDGHTHQELQRLLTQEMASGNSNLPIMQFMILLVFSFLAWLGAAICGIISLTRRRRPPVAIAALVVCSLMFASFCGLVVFG